MSVIHYSDKMLNKYPFIYSQVQQGFLTQIIYYVLDSRYRKAYNLRNWLDDQFNDVSDLLTIAATKIPVRESYDEQAIEVLKYVRNHLTYTADSSNWSADEYWATANEIVQKWKDDCDGFAVLTYVLCRLKGIPADRLLIMTGDVEGGGHAWLAYKPINYPHNYVFLDGCYWYTNKSVKSRNIFTVIEKGITEFQHNSLGFRKIESKYKSIWFAFNEDVSYSRFKLKKLV